MENKKEKKQLSTKKKVLVLVIYSFGCLLLGFGLGTLIGVLG